MIKEIPIKSWKQLRGEFDVLTDVQRLDNKWLFRGQADSNWKLESSLDRKCRKLQKNGAEAMMLNAVRRNIGLYNRPDVNFESTFQVLSFLQHYGAPTRLLDVSLSPYVAAFFALEAPADNAAIYAFDQNHLYAAMSSLEKKCVPLFQALQANKMDIREEIVFQQLRESSETAFVYNTQPFHLFDRLKTQSGGFLIQGSLAFNFEDNLKETFALPNIGDVVKKYIVPDTIRKEAMADLKRMNISRETLFPGIEGFVQSLFNTYETELYITMHGHEEITNGK